MDVFPNSGWARWLLIPVTVVVIMFLPPDGRFATLALLGFWVVVGFVGQTWYPDTSVEGRWFYLVFGGTLLAALAVAVAVGGGGVTGWIGLFAVTFGALTGYASGAFIANLRSASDSSTPDGRDDPEERRSERPRLGELLARANEMTTLRTRSAGGDAQELPATEEVEVLVDGRWRSGSLVAWETRELVLYAHVVLAEGGTGSDLWLPADSVRRAGRNEED